jgi:CheY-like chemotaxis protein
MAMYNHVLLVEDDPITILVCDRVLRMTDFAKNIVSKKNGQEGIEYIKELIINDMDLPQIIFLDINMPVMNGWDFLNEFSVLQSDCKSIPKIYILSSTVDPEDRKKAELYPMAGSISKPLTKEHLEKLV